MEIQKQLKKDEYNILIDKNYIKLKNSFKSSMLKITDSAITYIDHLYSRLTNLEWDKWNFLDDLTTLFWLKENEKNDFIAYMVVNSYNAWDSRIRVLIKNYYEKNKNNLNLHNKWHTAKSLLTLITTYWQNSEKGNLRWYWLEASNYTAKVIAANQAVEELEEQGIWINKKLYRKKISDKIINISYINKPIYRRNFTKRVKPYMDYLKENNLYEYKIIKTLSEASKLTQWNKPYLKHYKIKDFQNIPLKLDWIGQSKWVNEKYLYFTELTFQTLKEIANEINNKLNIKIRITSAFRPKIYNNKIKWSSPKSPHQSGSGFDISLAHLSKVYPILKKFDKNWKIILTKESDHFHITVTNPQYRKMIK